MSDSRPKIPEPIKRKVRQRCGFGCVVCGVPVYDYHHMIPHAQSQEHEEQNITLLCVYHHRKITNKHITDQQVSRANANPHNINHGISSPYRMEFDGEEAECSIGGNSFINRFSNLELSEDKNVPIMRTIAIMVDDQPIIGFHIDSSRKLFLNANIFDQYNLRILTIRDNEIIYSVDTFDIEFKGSTLILREKASAIFFEIIFKLPNKIIINRARLLCNGVEILVRKSHIFAPNGLFKGCFSSNVDVGLYLGRKDYPISTAFRNSHKVLRYGTSSKELRAKEKKLLSRN